MRLSDLQTKEVISVDGKKVGVIVDVVVEATGKIKALILDNIKSRRFINNSKDEKEIIWEQIIRIGEDIILVDTSKSR
ncbi:MAG: YlmC/YmxH family sporulation protein [bacterium]|nr:YlmC/YmxH family sporulation protein [bacterium]